MKCDPYENSTEWISEFQNIRNGLSFVWPTLPDYDGAKLALIRLQRTYNLSTSDLLAGNVADHVTNQPLSQQMALEIAMSATENGFYDEAFSFLTEAQRHLVQPLSSAKDLLLAIGNTYLGAVHKVCHAILMIFDPPLPLSQTVTNLGPPLKSMSHFLDPPPQFSLYISDCNFHM